eukprot:TRINITY_DN757_c0_g1_i9.p1 TRINITY_DN757_c0_g1~~TRINITY_DN757_c0_g1_i9.p1  ORF type:complete len:325 (+),score=32.71 TRINITY_DN757_c0_g1_i9:137-1111(+)
MIRRPPRSTLSSSSAASDVYKRQLSVSGLLCASSPLTRPRVAVCVSGMARTFSNLLEHRSLKGNMIEALGASVTSFAFLKTDDKRSDIHAGEIEYDRSLVLAAAQYIGASGSRLRVTNQSYNPLPACPNYPIRTGNNLEDRINSPEFEQSHLGQLNNKYQCYQMIVEYERQTKSRFDFVLVTRPDITWYAPLAPWCINPLTNLSIPRAQSPIIHLTDWITWIPRQHVANFLSEPYKAYHNCSRPLALDETMEAWMISWISRFLETRFLDAIGEDQPKIETLLPGTLTRVGGEGMDHSGCRDVHVRGLYDQCPNVFYDNRCNNPN